MQLSARRTHITLHDKNINLKSDPFYLHCLALRPFIQNTEGFDLDATLWEIEESGPDNFLSFLQEQGLTPLWHGVLSTIHPLPARLESMMEKLHLDRLNAVANYMMQKHTILKVHAAFTDAGITYAVFKGTQVRELVHAEPALRPASDIDILIDKNSREHAIQVLARIGMRKIVTPDNLSHECTFMDNTVQIDLHWHVLRPGRLSPGMTQILLNQPQWINGFYGLNDDATLFVMLIHPAFAKYVCSPYATLNRMIDLYFWMHQRPCNWDKIFAWARQAGVRTAVWATLYWLNLLTRDLALTDILRKFQPGALRHRYLGYWIDHNLPTRWIRHRQLLRFGFTLGLHDNIGGIMRFLMSIIKIKFSKES